MSLPSKTLCINPSKLYTLEHKSDLEKISEIINIPYQKIKKTIYRNKDKKPHHRDRNVFCLLWHAFASPIAKDALSKKRMIS